MRCNLLPTHRQYLVLIFLLRGPPPPHPHYACLLPSAPEGCPEVKPVSTKCRLGLEPWGGVGRGGAGPYVLLRSAECGSGVRVGKRSVKQLCNPLDADQGAPLSRRGPSDWLGVGTRDRHVAVLAQPAWVSLETEWRCC